MSIATYSDLQSAVAEWLARSDLTTRIPDFITLCEAKLNRSLFSNRMEKRSTTNIDMASSEPEFISVPSNFQMMRRIRLSSVTGKPRLEFVSGAQADDLRQQNANTAGQPRYFTIFGDEIELVPTPDQAYTLEMVYRAYLTPLSDANPSNWLLLFAPDIYLYGALLESAPYIKEDARIPTWVSGFTSCLDSLNSLSQAQTFNAGPMAARLTGSIATP